MSFCLLLAYFRRIHPLTLGLLLVFPALISCNIGQTTAGPPGPISTTISPSIPTPASHDGTASTPINPIDKILADCIRGEMAVHIHVRLTITVDGRPLPIPPGVGVTPGCIYPLHTHNDSGVIHIEHASWEAFNLGDFFVIGRRWGEFDPIAGMQVVRVWVNGEQRSADYRTLPLTDGLDVRLDLVRLTSA